MRLRHTFSTPIETTRLRLVPGTAELTTAAVSHRGRFSDLLDAQIPLTWPPELMTPGIQSFVAEMLVRRPELSGWWLWYIVLKGHPDPMRDTLIGSTMFKGPPRAGGVLEVGYAILEAFQGKGYATEATSALVRRALQVPGVSEVAAETFPTLPASIRVMEKCGMRFIGAGLEQGTIRYSVVRRRAAKEGAEPNAEKP